MNEKQRDGMERAGETGEIIDRRAGERRAAAPVVAVVAVDLSSLTRYHHNEFSKEIHNDPIGEYYLVADVQALASQAQAAVSAPALVNIEHLSRYDLIFNDGEACIEECAGGDYVHFDDVEKLLAAQATVGVASQQEQQPQPSCMPPFAAPASQREADLAGALRELIDFAEPTLERLGFGYMGKVEKAKKVLREQSSTAGSAKGGITNNSGAASPDLASIASQAQGEPTVEEVSNAFKATGLKVQWVGTHPNYKALTVGSVDLTDIAKAFVALRATPTES